LRSPGPHFIYN
jgi:hypothetical protein